MFSLLLATDGLPFKFSLLLVFAIIVPPPGPPFMTDIRDCGGAIPPVPWAMDMRELPLMTREAGFFMTEDGTGMDEGWAFPSGPFCMSV